MSNPRLPNGILSKVEAEPYLAPLVSPLLEAFWESWGWVEKIVESDDLAKSILVTSTVAGMVSDAFAHFSRPRLEPFRPRWRSCGRFHRAVFRETLSLRFKKFTPDLQAMNIHTHNQTDAYLQREPGLPGARRLTGITLGYTLRQVTRAVTGIYFTCPIGFEENGWVWPIYEAGEEQMRLFAPPTPTPEGKIEDVLAVKIDVKRRKAKNR